MAFKQPAGLEPGIYFGMREERYHKDPALSHSGMVDLLIHPLQYWEKSPLNPQRSFTETDAMKFGKRCHALLLEPENFFKEYAVQGGKDVNAKKKYITRADFQNVQDSVEIIKADPAAYAYFSDGYPEVSIVVIHPETGIRVRVRIDWLRIFGGIDYKRAKDIEDNPLGWTIATFGYDIQAVLYTWAIKEIKRLLREGSVKAHGIYDAAWLDRFIAEEQTGFCFFFQRSVKPYVFDIRFFDDEINSIAETRMLQAIETYRHFIEKYGAGRWPHGNAKPREFSIYNLPRRFIDQGVKY